MPDSFDLQILLCLKPGQKMSKCTSENNEGNTANRQFRTSRTQRHYFLYDIPLKEALFVDILKY